MPRTFFEKISESLLAQGVKKILEKIFNIRQQPKTPTSPPDPEVEVNKVHPWRLCGEGRHWVISHPLTVPISENNPTGRTIRHGHCSNNPSRKNGGAIEDYMNKDEIDSIADSKFPELKDLPNLGALPEFHGSEKYDPFIQGWTKYWNEVLKPKTPLDPNIIKALIASESGFKLNPRPQNAGSAGKARGLIQLTDTAIKILSNPEVS